MERTYIAIDLKSFYASVECAERHFDPLTTNLVVADSSRTEKTICLAVSPSLKAYGIPGRARLFEVIHKVREVNRERLSAGIKSGHHHDKRLFFCVSAGKFNLIVHLNLLAFFIVQSQFKGLFPRTYHLKGLRPQLHLVAHFAFLHCS